MEYNFSSLTPSTIDSWNIDQICVALVEAKKIEKIFEQLKERAREQISPGKTIKVSNGSVKVTAPGKLFSIVNQNIVPEAFLLPPIRPLDKKKVRVYFTSTEGQLPVGIGVRSSKSSVTVRSK